MISKKRKVRFLTSWGAWASGQEVEFDIPTAKALAMRGILVFADKKRNDMSLRLLMPWRGLPKGTDFFMPKDLGEPLLRARFARLLRN